MLKSPTIRPAAWILAGSMLHLLVALLPTLRSAMRSRRDLVIENLALRQQLATLAGRRHAVIRPADRLFWILLRPFSSVFIRTDLLLPASAKRARAPAGRWHRPFIQPAS